ncbi:hypothetical protein BD779DRAFT_1677574 [Infundibulicybe gibba]|nr:hypothetical protein BD779DRAFT_1677574 [Infundibulicybe gibba]
MNTGLINQLIKILDRDKNARGEHTKSLVTGARTRYPYFDVVVCHGQYDFKWKCVEVKDWLHQHEVFDTKVGGTVEYKTYIVCLGDFRNPGDVDI